MAPTDAGPGDDIDEDDEIAEITTHRSDGSTPERRRADAEIAEISRDRRATRRSPP